jgi:hypothetical protein
MSRELRRVLLKVGEEWLLQGNTQRKASLIDGLLFPSEAGRWRCIIIYARVFKPLLTQAGLRKKTGWITPAKLRASPWE